MAGQSAETTSPKEPIDVKEAVQRAMAFLREVFGTERIRDVRLEEVDFADAENLWIVTLSFLRPIPDEEIPSWERDTRSNIGTEYRREYKSVDVDPNGKVHAIRMRSPV